jgi:hypothetical protein
MMSTPLALLHATLAFAVLRPIEPELVMLHRWLDSWRGLGDIVTGMRRQGFKLGLEDFGERWVAAFYRGSGGHEGAHRGWHSTGAHALGGGAAGGVGGGEGGRLGQEGGPRPPYYSTPIPAGGCPAGC